jgi:Uma2 family endonuclease
MSSPTTTTTPPDAPVPPLVAGQRLTCAEFERRYDAMPHLKKAELIEGVVVMPSPVRVDHHGAPHSSLVMWLAVYRAHTPGVRAVDNGTIRLDETNEPQPDATLFIARGGQARVDEDDYLEGAPELVAEVSASRLAQDLGPRMEAYRRNGIKEYIVWRVDAAAIDWFILRGQQYELLPLPGGVYRSEVFPGLWLDPTALIGDDLVTVLQVLQQGLASAEHAAFVADLQQRATRP